MIIFLLPNLHSPDGIAISLDPDLDFSQNLVFCLVLHFFIMIFLISYFRTFLTDPGKVPNYWQTMVLEELNRFDQEIQINYRLESSFRSISKSVDFRNKLTEENYNALMERNALSETSHDKVPDKENDNEESAIPPALDEMKLSELEDRFLKEKGFERWCTHCQNFKPPRSHHCRECGKCVLKMDHHCPWVLNCIGFYNYKLFFNMLIYGDVSILMITCSFSSFLREKISDLETETPQLIFIASVFACMIMISCLLTIFLMFHTMLVLKGKSTIEQCDKKKKIPNYDRGIRKNFLTVFGKNPLLWFLPVKVHDDEEGVNFNEKE